VDCIFCGIVAGKVPANIVYQDELVTAFRDIKPQAPIHILVIPNVHLESVSDLQPEHDRLVGHMISIANQLAVQEEINQSGYRLVINRGEHGGQSVYHLHVHLLGGRWMRWPPG
jgi:histidine triad (HIT) family protein